MLSVHPFTHMWSTASTGGDFWLGQYVEHVSFLWNMTSHTAVIDQRRGVMTHTTFLGDSSGREGFRHGADE